MGPALLVLAVQVTDWFNSSIVSKADGIMK